MFRLDWLLSQIHGQDIPEPVLTNDVDHRFQQLPADPHAIPIGIDIAGNPGP